MWTRKVKWFVAGLTGVVVVALTGGAAVAVPSPGGPIDPTFSFAVLPDTQTETKHPGDPRFADRTQWLARNQAALDLRFVAQVGDLVDWDTPDHYMFATAAAGMATLHAAGIPYSIAVGNHDAAAVCPGGSACNIATTYQTMRDTTTLNTYFTAADFGAVSDAYQPGKVDNVLSTFSAGGLQWGVLSLELWPRRDVVKWARRMVAEHPHHNIIVVTHSYLDADGSIHASGDYGDESPQFLFDRIIGRYRNVKMVFSGHAGTSAARVDQGRRGNTVYSFLQTFHDRTTNPLRLVTVDTQRNTLTTQVYAPFTDQGWPAWATTATDVTWVR
jgi:calcineurin-like phosphoesterase family protein